MARVCLSTGPSPTRRARAGERRRACRCSSAPARCAEPLTNLQRSEWQQWPVGLFQAVELSSYTHLDRSICRLGWLSPAHFVTWIISGCNPAGRRARELFTVHTCAAAQPSASSSCPAAAQLKSTTTALCRCFNVPR
jgi:hypothetical protein